MYERMLNKQEEPTIAQMTAYCGACADLFTLLNEWLSGIYGTAQTITFPYGNQYGWGVAHRINKKLICHVFAEENAFTVMMRLSNDQFDSGPCIIKFAICRRHRMAFGCSLFESSASGRASTLNSDSAAHILLRTEKPTHFQ